MASVPLPAMAKGWASSGASQTRRMPANARPKASMKLGARCPGGGPDAASMTAGEISIGPGIIKSVMATAF